MIASRRGRPRVRAPLATITAALALLSAPARAAAVDVAAPALHLRLRVDPAGGRVCVAFPEAQRNDAACPDVRLPPAAAVRADIEPNGNGPVALMVLAFPDMRVQVTLEQSITPQAHAPQPAVVASFVDSVRAGFSRVVGAAGRRLLPQEAGDGPERLTIHGVMVIRHVLRVAGGASETRVLMFHAFGRAGIASFSFNTDAAHLPRVEALARQVLATLAMPAAP